MFCVFPTGANLFINMLDCLDLAKHKQAGFVLFFCCCFLFKGIKKIEEDLMEEENLKTSKRSRFRH